MSSPILAKKVVAGGPVTCLTLTDRGIVLYGIGSYLHRTPPCTTRMIITEPISSQHQVFQQSTVLHVFNSPGGVLHGIRLDNNNQDNNNKFAVTIVFGGRQVAFIHNAGNIQIPMTVIRMEQDPPYDHQQQSSSNKQQQCLTVQDWIWDCRFSPPPRTDSTDRILLIGLAHNVVQMWSITVSQPAITKDTPILRIHCRTILYGGATRCLCYCLDMYWDDIDTKVTLAAGTVTNTILVWSFHATHQNLDCSPQPTTTSNKKESRFCQPEHCLVGHLGVIHAVRWNRSGNQIASTSDDRSVRLWQRYPNPQQDEWIQLWTGWGHTSRVWDVLFFDRLDWKHSSVLLSTGEDGTMRVWENETGTILDVARGHTCQCVWSVAAAIVSNLDHCQSVALVATAGNNGTVALYNLKDRLFVTRVQDTSDSCLGKRNQQIDTWSKPWNGSFCIPDNGLILDGSSKITLPNDCSVVLNGLRSIQKEKRLKIYQQVVIGMQFTPNQVPPSLVVATRSGSVMGFCLKSFTWIHFEPWCGESSALIDPSDGCCMTLHPTNSIAAFGKHNGDIVIANLRRQHANNVDTGETNYSFVLNAREHRSVQRIEWLNPTTLLSFHVQSMVWWDFHAPVDDLSNLDIIMTNNYSKLSLWSEAKGMAICSAFNTETKYLAVGDTRGNLSLFALSNLNKNDIDTTITSVWVQERVHQKEHVTALLWKGKYRLISVGNDGHIVESIVEDMKLVTLLSIPVGSFSNLSNIWCIRETQMIVGGYYGNKFAIVDPESGYEFFSFDTGGKQRSLTVCVGVDFPNQSLVGLCRSMSDGRNDIQVHSLGSSYIRNFRNSIGISLHGESIFDICLFPLDSECNSLALLTGSEDCSSKISLYQEGFLQSSKLLPLHVSGIRAVDCTRIKAGSTIIAIGGKVEVQLFLVNDVETDAEIHVRSLGFGRPPVKPSIDHRLNAVKIIPLNSRNHDSVLVVSGDSSGACYAFLFSGLYEDFTSHVELLYRDERPILSLDVLKLDDRYILLLGTTAGDLIAFLLDIDLWPDIDLVPILRISAHAMGTNTISARLVDSAGHQRLRICTAGDDQAIFCCDIDTEDDSKITILWQSTTPNAAISALKGAAYLDDDHIVTTGYDQRISIWRLDSVTWELSSIAKAMVDIGDINCLAHCIVKEGKHVLAVGGAGIELFFADLD